MINPPYRAVAVASTFSPRFLQVLAEAKRIRDRLASRLDLIYVGKKDEESTAKFIAALSQLDLPVDSIIHYREGDPADAILDVAKAKEIDLIVAGALEKKAVLRQFLGNVARRLVSEAECSVMLFTKPEADPKPLGRMVFMADYSDDGREALKKAIHLAELEKSEKLYVIRVYTTFDAARAKVGVTSSESGGQASRTLEEEEAALEKFIDSAGQTDVPIEARCIRGNTGYAVLDFVQSVEAMMLVVPVKIEPDAGARLPRHMTWVTDVIPCNLWVIR